MTPRRGIDPTERGPFRRPRAIVTLCATLVAVVVSSSALRGESHARDREEGWRAGVARVSITPEDPVWMAGYAARTGPSEGVLTDLHARVLVLEDAAARRLVVVTLDLIEIPRPLHERIETMAADRHAISPDQLLVNVSHTHGGPMVSSRTIADWGIDPIWGRRA